MCLAALLCSHAPSPPALPFQVPEAVGTFELLIRGVHNKKGVLADGRCCQGGLDPPCPPEEQCQTFFRACLKEYQLRALPGGPCVLGAATTPVLGGNVFSASHRSGLDHANRMVVPFDFAWPVRPAGSWQMGAGGGILLFSSKGLQKGTRIHNIHLDMLRELSCLCPAPELLSVIDRDSTLFQTLYSNPPPRMKSSFERINWSRHVRMEASECRRTLCHVALGPGKSAVEPETLHILTPP